MMSRVVYLPVVAEMPEFVLRDMAAAFVRVVEDHHQQQQQQQRHPMADGGDDDDDGDLGLDGIDLNDVDVVEGHEGGKCTDITGTRAIAAGGDGGNKGVHTSKPPSYTCRSKL